MMGSITYYTSVRTDWDVLRYGDKNSLLSAINGLQFAGEAPQDTFDS